MNICAIDIGLVDQYVMGRRSHKRCMPDDRHLGIDVAIAAIRYRVAEQIGIGSKAELDLLPGVVAATAAAERGHVTHATDLALEVFRELRDCSVDVGLSVVKRV